MSHILFLVSSMQGGGAERVAALLCNHWAKQGHQVTLMPTFAGRGECLYPLDERVRLDYLADRVGNRSRSLFNKSRKTLALRRAIRELSPNVVLSFLTNVNVTAIIATWGLSVPVVVSERTYPPAVPLGRLLELLRRLFYPQATAVVVQTDQALNWLRHCSPNSRGFVVPNPVALPLSRSERAVKPSAIIESQRRLLLAVGRLSEEKQFEKLVAAFNLLSTHFPEWDLVILGDGPTRAALEMTRDHFSLPGRVHFPGRVGNLSDWYERADLFVMSSRFEGFPNTLLEAMAHGLPAVSFDCDAGPRDIIRRDIDGFLVSPATGTAGLAEAINTLMKDERKRKHMAQAALDVRERYSIERIAAQWDSVMGLTDP